MISPLNPDEVIMIETALIHISKIKSPEILRDALKHNLRLIALETSLPSHISPSRSHLNTVLIGGEDPVKMTRETVNQVKQSTGKNLRSNGVFALEVIFTLQVNSSVQVDAFFKESLQWLRDYWNCPIIHAAIHMDEANPHMHVIVLPLRQRRMIGASLVGFKSNLATLKKDHHQEVGCRFGLGHVPSVPRFKRYAAAKSIIACLIDHPDWIGHPSIQAALVGAIAAKPAELLSVLGIKPDFG